MGGFKKPGPRSKPKKSRKSKPASLANAFTIKRGHAARARRAVLPI
jgi:hypothetical protein